MTTILEILLWATGVYAALAVAAHAAARCGLHRRIVPVRRQDLSARGIWGRANPWRIVIHDALTPQQEQWVLGHEWQHVTDYWLCGLYGFAVWKLIRRRSAVLWIESRGYAASVRAGHPIDDAARAMSRHTYDYDITHERALREIERWL